ncbi:MAG: DNA-processing protein DprA [bacterium]
MKHLNALNKIPGLGSKKLKLLMSFFSSSKDAWEANFDQLLLSGIPKLLAEKIVAERPNIDVDAEWEKLEKENIIAASIHDPNYPALLKQIPDHPYLIYMKGDLSCLDYPLVAIVGSRKLTEYGERVANGFARDLARNEICVVSGLAFGVDAKAHLGALGAKGRTIAVLGNSLDEKSIAPRSNFNLSQNIINNGGLLVSEFPVETSANVGTFPARNRIMAGMSLGTLVIEAAQRSGSLITANLTLDYNREVFAVPGSIFSPQSTGTNMLIKNGAKLVTSINDVLEELRLNNNKTTKIQEEKMPKIELTTTEKNVYKILTHEALHIDRITKLTKLDTSTICSILAILEIKGAIKNVGGQNYILI